MSQNVGVGKHPASATYRQETKAQRDIKQFACGPATHLVADSGLEPKTPDSRSMSFHQSPAP